jgi:hypothetical protein
LTHTLKRAKLGSASKKQALTEGKTMSIATGHYAPAKPGAKTWREARDMYIGNEHVTAEVAPDGTATVFLGLRIAYCGPIPANVNDKAEFFAWVITVAETFAAGPMTAAEEDADGLTETEETNLKGVRYLAAFVDSNYGMPWDDREHELIKTVEHAKRELWTRAVHNYGRTRYIDTSLNERDSTSFPGVTDDAEMVLYRFEVVNGEIQREEYPTHRIFMGPRGGIRVERY